MHNDRRGNSIDSDGLCFLSIDGEQILLTKIITYTYIVRWSREKAQQMFEMIVYTVPFDIIRKSHSEV